MTWMPECIYCHRTGLVLNKTGHCATCADLFDVRLPRSLTLGADLGVQDVAELIDQDRRL